MALKNLISAGWMPVNRNLLQERNIFYPESWEFMIKPPTVLDIRNWSVIDNDDPEQIDVVQVRNVFIEIFEKSFSIYDHATSQLLHWSEINEWDKYFWLLLIRDYTFPKGEAKFEQEEECPECDLSVTYKLDALSLYYDLPDPEVMLHWDQRTRTWRIDPNEYGIESDEYIILSAPTFKKSIMITQYEYECKKQGSSVEMSNFFRYLPWLLPDVPDDYEAFKKLARELWRKVKHWGLRESLFIDEVIRNITINPPSRLQTTCTWCGEQPTLPIRFNMEVTLYLMFKINLRNLIKNKLQICKNYHIQPSEFDRLQYWEMEYFLQDINNDIEEEQERRDAENKQYDPSQYNPSNFKVPDYTQSMPSFSMPSMPSF